MKQNEPALIARILNGEGELYGQLIDRHKNGLYRHCFQFVRDEDWAADICQEAFIKAYLHLESYNANYRFSTWLYKIATNQALQELRKKRPQLLDEAFEIVSTKPGADQLAKDSELWQAVDKLPPKQRTAVMLHYKHGKSYAEIADDMHSTPGSIKGWMSRAKYSLKRMLS